jgi:hypothetical protein
MGLVKTCVLIAIEADFAAVENNSVAPYKIDIPKLSFLAIKEYFDAEVSAGCKIDLRVANDYLDWASLELSKRQGGIQNLLDQCANGVKKSPPKRGQAKIIDVAKAWGEIQILPDREKAAPPSVFFLEASASSIINLGIWIGEVQRICGDFSSKKGMDKGFNKFLNDFFGAPFKPGAMISHQSMATPEQIRQAMGRSILGRL